MGNKYRLTSLVESRKLLWLIAVLFAVAFSIQYFELPYGSAFLSLFSSGKGEVALVGNLGNSSSSSSVGKSLANGSVISSNSLNSTDPITSQGISNVTELSDGKDAKEKHSDDSFDVVGDSDPEDESPSKDFTEVNHNLTVMEVVGGTSLAPEKALESHETIPASNATSRNNVSLDSNEGQNIEQALAGDETVDTRLSKPSDTIPPSDSPPPSRSPEGVGINSGSPVKNAANASQKSENPGFLKTDLVSSVNDSPKKTIPKVKDRPKDPEDTVFSLSAMNDMLLQSITSYHAMKPRWTSGTDQELLLARSLIEKAPKVKDDTDLYAPLYRNFSMFRRSYELMEQTLKIYIYKEGGKPIFHQPVLKGIYASEGWFMKQLKASRHFVTKTPGKAHLFYLPFSTRMLEEMLYVPNSHSHRNLVQYLNNYLNLITSRYSFWNRTGGADHFFVACHDWAPSETKRIMAPCIRALCNSDIKEGFQFGKDVSLAETYVRSAQKPLRQLGGQPPSKRRILAFFAGNMHGYLRPILLQYWENRDPDMKIFGQMPMVKGQMNYIQHMKSSKYCICAKGYEVNSPRVVEAIFYECVPVIISDNFVPPFFETLNWESFAVFVLEKDIPNLKNILLSIPEKKYLQMQKRVKLVQQHFLWHSRPVKYDIFHMILHSIWYTRVFQISSR
ncbi:hypothetical protein ACH5RR_039676 [Cinchona calisaya]|uniref:Exostosin GT47 domain-containing protein n=1 Tax=Cinchona calisaya TaxID=153742 RepID=A0ABD2Y4J0_9GENT